MIARTAQPTSSLKEKIDRFLPALRVGIDLGESAGGIAVVKGGEILHAETYVDFHDATLEQRRQLRRGRRTRHAKKMRLARLRSWVLRQSIPASIPGARSKNGKHYLPDPYEILKVRRFWVQPEVYRIKGKNPAQSRTWLDLAKGGEVDAAGFVRALTLIFKKRGYKYDDGEFSDYNDKRLIDFLNSCCLLRDAPDMKQALDVEINRREESEGKSKPKLWEAYQSALDRRPEPRKALPRQIKENELRQIVTAFGGRHNLDEKTVEQWKKEIIGLLNKVLRQPRFDNRVRSGCSWCGKKTPRLSRPNVREKAFRAAVGNLRVRQDNFSRRTRPLTEEEKKPFLDWWRKRHAENFKFPKGAKVPLIERAPTLENLEKYLEGIHVEKRWMRDSKGKGKLTYPMLPQLNDLLNRAPRSGRANLCMEHLEMAAQGKSMKDAGIERQTARVRRAPNPRREQHDARVLKRLENILFTKDKQGEESWKFGPVSFLTLEIPEPQTEKVGKGQQTERKSLTFRQRLHAETSGMCIYCGKEISAEEMKMEHIVPRAGGGPDLQINRITSCDPCNTQKADRLPSEWLMDGKWEGFEERVKRSNLSEFKKMLLLLPMGEPFPDDPTPLARVGARSGAFTAEIIELFKRYGVEPPTLEYTKDRSHLQRVAGRWTSQMRLSYLYKDKEAKIKNFPEKDRTDLFNHAQDAALLAATPPHTWRNQIFIEEAVRPCVKKDNHGNLVMNKNEEFERELRARPGVALLSLAPDWADFMKNRSHPIVRILGRQKATWKSQLMDLSLYQNPASLTEPALSIHKPLDEPKTNGQRRQTVKSQKGGLVIQVPHHDGTTGIRKVQVKPIQSEAIICWRNPKAKKGNFNISLVRPRALEKFVKRLIDPPIPQDAVRLGRLERGRTILLESQFYRVKELSDSGVIVIPENAMTDALAERIGIPKGKRSTPPERKLGKKELQRYFA